MSTKKSSAKQFIVKYNTGMNMHDGFILYNIGTHLRTRFFFYAFEQSTCIPVYFYNTRLNDNSDIIKVIILILTIIIL